MDGPHWSPRSAVRREDQFTVAPEFFDVYGSDPLPLWTHSEVSWHGVGPKRRVFLMTSIARLAIWGRTSAAFAFDDVLGQMARPRRPVPRSQTFREPAGPRESSDDGQAPGSWARRAGT